MKYFIGLFLLILSLQACQKNKKESPVLEPTNPQYVKGKQLFDIRCYDCHRMEKRLIGPPLKNLTQKYDKNWLLSFIVNSQKMIKEQDPKAIKIWNEYGQGVMPSFKELKDDELENLYFYLEHYKSTSQNN